ncbi:MAG: DUF799 family lipoprotein [Oleibacter sp.]|nr:DUF799 family lipoprotein [Thalassolituus sp.]
MTSISFIKTPLLLSLLVSVLFTAGCATRDPYNYDALIAAKPRSILVIPPNNDTVEVGAPYVYISTISRPLAEKGYYVFPVAVIDQFMKENGLPTPDEMNQVPLDKIREIIGADAVLYITINQWGQKYNVLSSKAMVDFSMKLVDARTGNLLWDARASAVNDPGSSGGGLLGALVSAAVNQVVGSLSDATPELARTANYVAIDDSHRGLLNGPYAPVPAQ